MKTKKWSAINRKKKHNEHREENNRMEEVDEKVECKQSEEETQSMSPERKTINRVGHARGK